MTEMCSAQLLTPQISPPLNNSGMDIICFVMGTGIAECRRAVAGRSNGMLSPCWRLFSIICCAKSQNVPWVSYFRPQQRQIFMGYYNKNADDRQTNANLGDEKAVIIRFYGAMTHPDNIFIHGCISL